MRQQSNDRPFVNVDEMFRGAEAARENYCTSVVSMGVGLKAKKDSTRGGKTGSASSIKVPPPKKKTAEMGVGTEDLPFPEAGQGPPTGGVDAASTEGQPEKAAQERQEPAFEEDEGSDVVSYAIGSSVSVLFWILKTVFFSFPVSVVTGSLSFFLFFVVFSLISMQFADDSGALMMGAGIDTMFNRPGIV